MLSNERVRSVACGGEITAVVTDGGAAYTWGSGLFGQLGHGGTEGSDKPVKVQGSLKGLRVSAVACGIFHMLALDDNGNVYSWGDASSGQVMGRVLPPPYPPPPLALSNSWDTRTWLGRKSIGPSLHS